MEKSNSCTPLFTSLAPLHLSAISLLSFDGVHHIYICFFSYIKLAYLCLAYRLMLNAGNCEFYNIIYKPGSEIGHIRKYSPMSLHFASWRRPKIFGLGLWFPNWSVLEHQRKLKELLGYFKFSGRIVSSTSGPPQLDNYLKVICIIVSSLDGILFLVIGSHYN